MLQYLEKQHNMENILEAIKTLEKCNKTNTSQLIREFSSFSNQDIPEEIAKEFDVTGLLPIDILTSDFLKKKGFKNLYDINREKPSMLQMIVDSDTSISLLKADGFDEAIIGYDSNDYRLIYSVKKCIEILCKDMSEEEALEHFDFNVRGAHVGEKTPIWCEDNF